MVSAATNSHFRCQASVSIILGAGLLFPQCYYENLKVIAFFNYLKELITKILNQFRL